MKATFYLMLIYKLVESNMSQVTHLQFAVLNAKISQAMHTDTSSAALIFVF